jgi:hypothetical protein
VGGDKIPQQLKDAFVAIEDERFYEHNGIDIKGIMRAAAIGAKNKFNFSQGASTITQQLIKNSVFDKWATGETKMERVKRKIQEQYLATELEKNMSKDDILVTYMNTINLGQNTLGVQAASLRYFGKPVYDVHADLFGDTELKFTEQPTEKADVVFFCTAHGETGKLLAEYNFPSDVKIIDMTNEFRVGDTGFVYGLPEINREAIKKCNRLANPGCFATAIQLALVPSLKAGIIQSDIQVSAVTGSTGAGQKLSPTSHFSWRNNNFSVYKAFTHQHLAEINHVWR